MRANQIILLGFLVFIISSCLNSNSKELISLRIENDSLRLLIDSLSNTLENRFNYANKLAKENNDSMALDAYQEIVNNYPNTPYAEKAESEVLKIKKEIETRIQEQERLKNLGFDAIEAKSNVDLGYLNMKFSDIQFKESFVFDSYDDRYHYLSAERGSKYLVMRATITSEVNNPSLPFVLAYVLKNGKLINLTPIGLQYKFRRWEDYGSYLGNNADYGNDFAQTSSINFNLGSQIREEQYKGFPVYVILHKAHSHFRKVERFDSPPVSYSPNEYNFKNELEIEDLSLNGEYVLLKRL